MTTLLLLAACGTTAPAPTAEDARPSPAAGSPDVILVSLDTTRGDMADAATMPNLDRLAREGARFSWAFSHAPTTASSHAALFTGLDPHGHGVVRNGHRLRDDVPTLAERFRDAGWDTAGFVAASVLDRATGLDRGFATWSLELPVARTRRHEARAEQVVDAARARIAAQPTDRPLFLFVHLYDPHGPYDAPAPWTRRFGDPAYDGPVDGTPASTTALANALRAGNAAPANVAELRARYRGELGYADAHLGRLLAARRSRPTLVAVLSDHGEALGDDVPLLQPIGHGADVDLVATHVPLVLAGPGIPTGVTSEATVATSNVGATLLARAGLAGGLGHGEDLAWAWSAVVPPHVGAVPLEATQPVEAASKTGWPNLPLERGVVRGDTLLVETPWRSQPARLYARAEGQPVREDAATTTALTEALRVWDGAAPKDGTAEQAQMKEALKALGYAE